MDQQMEENIHENNGTFLKKNIIKISSNEIDFFIFFRYSGDARNKQKWTN